MASPDTVSSVGESEYIFVKDLDGDLGRMEAGGRGMREICRPDGSWIPYYCDGSPISEDQARALATRLGIENVDLHAPTAVEDNGEDVGDPYG